MEILCNLDFIYVPSRKPSSFFCQMPPKYYPLRMILRLMNSWIIQEFTFKFPFQVEQASDCGISLETCFSGNA